MNDFLRLLHEDRLTLIMSLPVNDPALCAAAFLLSAGCESAESNDVTITPGHATVSLHGSVALSANGWDNFRWSLSDGSLGVLSATVGRSVVYTAVSGGEAVQHVTATAIGYGGTSSSTNATSSVGFQATATISHK